MKKDLTIISIRPLVTRAFLVTCAFCILLFFQNPVMAQTQTDGTGVLPSQLFDTRSLAMGSATIADVYGKPSIGINAALFGLFNEPQYIQFNTNHNWDTNFLQHSLSLPAFSYGPHHVTMRFGLLHRGPENLPFTSSASMNEPDLSTYRAEIGYALALSNHVSLGTLQSVSYTTAGEGEQQWNYVSDIGLVYIPDGAVSYGLVFRGLGYKTTYDTVGTGQTTLDDPLARQILEIGATLRYPVEERTFLSISFANEKRFGEEGLWYKGGVEVTPIPMINLRGGIVANFDQSEFLPRVGLGINTRMVQVDYTIGDTFHQFGLTIKI